MKQSLLDGRYSTCVSLGCGGIAEVFLAHDEVLGRDVALKMLKDQYAEDEEFVKRFRREARSAAALNHPHVVTVYDWGRSEAGAHYMAMEYVAGGTLKDRILEDGPLPPRTAAGVASQIAAALRAAHERGVIHRDVKPQNILLTDARDAKVADFGIARAAAATTTSRSDLVLGTADYMSPEQAKGGPVGPRSDLYSLGVVLYEMLTGGVPYEADAPVSVAARHVTDPPRSPREANPEVPEGIDALTLRLLAKDPADRHGSAAELVEDLRRAGDGLPPALADAGSVAAAQAALPAPPVPASPGGNGILARPAVVYGRRSRKPAWALAAALVALLVLPGANAWGPWWASQEQLRAPQDVARGPLDELGEAAFEEGERADGPKEEEEKEEVPDAGGLSEEGREGPIAEVGGSKLGDLESARSAVAPENGIADQDLRAGIPVEPGTEVVGAVVGPGPEQVGVAQVSGGSTEKASQVLPSDSVHVTASRATRHSSEPAGTAIGTDPATGSMPERGTSVPNVVSGAPTNWEGGDRAEEAAPASEPEANAAAAAATLPSTAKKRDQKPPTAVFAKVGAVD